MNNHENNFNPFHSIIEFLKSLIRKVDRVTELLETLPSLKDRDYSKPMTVETLCEYLDAAESTIYGKINRNEIPHHREPSGRRIYFFRDEIDAWLKSK